MSEWRLRYSALSGVALLGVPVLIVYFSTWTSGTDPTATQLLLTASIIGALGLGFIFASRPVFGSLPLFPALGYTAVALGAMFMMYMVGVVRPWSALAVVDQVWFGQLFAVVETALSVGIMAFMIVRLNVDPTLAAVASAGFVGFDHFRRYPPVDPIGVADPSNFLFVFGAFLVMNLVVYRFRWIAPSLWAHMGWNYLTV